VLISDRRLAKAVSLVRVAVYATGAEAVSEIDLLLLQHMFWDREPSQAHEVRKWLIEHCVPVFCGGDVGVENSREPPPPGILKRRRY